jgi:hypothetical protein
MVAMVCFGTLIAYQKIGVTAVILQADPNDILCWVGAAQPIWPSLLRTLPFIFVIG